MWCLSKTFTVRHSGPDPESRFYGIWIPAPVPETIVGFAGTTTQMLVNLRLRHCTGVRRNRSCPCGRLCLPFDPGAGRDTFRLFHEHGGQIENKLREYKEEDDAYDQRNKKRVHTCIDYAHRHFRDVPYHEDAHGDRRDHRSHADGEGYHDTCPYRVVPHLKDRREEYGSGEDHERQVVNKRPAYKIDDEDDAHDDVAVQGKPHHPRATMSGILVTATKWPSTFEEATMRRTMHDVRSASRMERLIPLKLMSLLTTRG